MKRALLIGMLIATQVLFTTGDSRAEVVLFDSADGNELTSGVGFDDDSFFMHRFEVSQSTTTKSVGGTFLNFDGSAATFFGAIVELTGASDVPNSLDLSGADVVGTTLLSIDGARFNGVDLSAPLSVSLNPGWHALVFGSGKFGASSGPDVDLAMPSFETDLAPSQNPASLFQPSHPNFPNFVINQISTPQFIVTAIPEPSSAMLLATGAVSFSLRRRRR